MSEPMVENIKRHNGVAGQISYTADVTYPGGSTDRVEFVGSAFGGPVLMIMASGAQTFVSDPNRFGKFGPDWVRAFFA